MLWLHLSQIPPSPYYIIARILHKENCTVATFMGFIYTFVSGTYYFLIFTVSHNLKFFMYDSYQLDEEKFLMAGLLIQKWWGHSPTVHQGEIPAFATAELEVIYLFPSWIRLHWWCNANFWTTCFPHYTAVTLSKNPIPPSQVQCIVYEWSVEGNLKDWQELLKL